MRFDVCECGHTRGLPRRCLCMRDGVPVLSLRKIPGGKPVTMVEFRCAERAPRPPERVFLGPEYLLDLTSQLPEANGVAPRGGFTFRQVGNALAHNLEISHDFYEPSPNNGEKMIEHASHENVIVISGIPTVSAVVGTPGW